MAITTSGDVRETSRGDWERRGVRPWAEYQRWWAQAGIDLEVGDGAEEEGAGMEMED